MKKTLKYILIGVPCVLIILLGINIYKYISYQNDNELIIESTNSYNNKINKNKNKLDNLNDELTSLKEEKEDKLWEYERWIKWKKEMLELIK